MGVNPAEQGVDNALVNQIKELQQQIIDMKTKPQPIGNGSLGYAVGAGLTWGPTTIVTGDIVTFTTTLFSGGLTYAGLPAINRITFLDFFFTVSVDTNDTAHDYPTGASLTSGQKKFVVSQWVDLANTNYSESSGQRKIIIQITNFDTVTHNYYIRGNFIIPRPALKPQ